MKILAFLLGMFPALALAQVGPDIYRPATGAQILGYDSTSRTITERITNRVVRLVCTTDCYVTMYASGQSFPATSVTGIFLPARVPETFSISPNSFISVTRSSTSGNLHVQELTR